MIDSKLTVCIALSFFASFSACSSNHDPRPENNQTVLYLESEAGHSETGQFHQVALDLVQNNNHYSRTIEYLQVKHHQVECEGFHVGHCLLVQDADRDQWRLFYEQIDGFEYQWGVSYELLVIVADIDVALADVSQQRYTLLEVISEKPSDIRESFNYTSHDSQERIVEVAPGQYSLLGGKEFSCTLDNCGSLRSALDQNHSALLSFQHGLGPDDLLILDAVLCSDSKHSFTASCL